MVERISSLSEMMKLILFMYFINIRSKVMSLDLSKCRSPLGMYSMAIPDSAITASSSYDEDTVGPRYARLNQDISGGAWCPKPPINKTSYEYLEINLSQLYVITLVETQGRHGKGQGQEYTRHYLLDYQRENQGRWMRFRNRRGKEILQGNKNTNLPEMRDISPSIIARKVRFIPYSEHQRTVCMRVELYGCLWQDGVISYDMPQGSSRSSGVTLHDFSYDGTIRGNFLHGGMGQLMDGVEGPANFRHDLLGHGNKGYEWIGWKNSSYSSKPVEITFNFDVPRNFSHLKVHCNNYFKKDVRVFRMALIFFSIGGQFYRKEAVRFDFVRDDSSERSRYVTIRLYHNIARHIKLFLLYDARWMMISEISFYSHPVKGNISRELTYDSNNLLRKMPDVYSNHLLHKRLKGTENKKVSSSSKYIRHNEILKKSPGHRFSVLIPKTTSTPEEVSSIEDKRRNLNMYGIIGGVSGAFVFILITVVLFVVFRRRLHKRNRRQNIKNIAVRHVNGNHNDELQIMTSSDVTNGNVYNGYPYSNFNKIWSKNVDDPVDVSSLEDTIQSRQLPELPANDMAGLTVRFPEPSQSLRSEKCNRSISIDKPPNYDSLYAATDLFAPRNALNIQSVTGSSAYAIPNPERFRIPEFIVPEFQHINFRFIEVLGEGQFGEVHLCEVLNVDRFLTEDQHQQRSNGCGILVAVKMLRREASEHARKDFLKEMAIMSQLNNVNVVQVLGVCTRDEPLAMIVEYMKYGDLHQFLRDHSFGNASSLNVLSYGCLIYIAGQIASGMKYLESLTMVHRDLATRNCLVGHNYQIKISDFGMSRSLYSSDYYRVEGRAILPIRWMAWESIFLGRFTTKSDVWSFSVTLWEVLTFATEQPYNDLTDEMVIENAGHYYRDDCQWCLLPRPVNCPIEIFDLMCECWNRNENDRPTFIEIHMFLQHKNVGYNPHEEKLLLLDIPVC